MHSTERPAPRPRRYWRKHHYLLFDAPGSQDLAALLAAAARVHPRLTDEQIIERFAWEFRYPDMPGE